MRRYTRMAYEAGFTRDMLSGYALMSSALSDVSCILRGQGFRRRGLAGRMEIHDHKKDNLLVMANGAETSKCTKPCQPWKRRWNPWAREV